MSESTRSKISFKATSISELQYKAIRKQKINKFGTQKQQAITNMSASNNTDEPKHDQKTQIMDLDNSIQEKLEELRAYEQNKLQSIKLLTEDEMIDIDQWLQTLHNIYEELKYPKAFRVYQATMYFLEEEKQWYEEEKLEINNDWSHFCKKLKLYIINRISINNENLLRGITDSSNKPTLSFEQIISNKFNKYSGKNDPEDWLLQTMNQFKQYQLSHFDQLRVIPFLLEDIAYLWYVKNEQLFIDFQTFSKLFIQQFSMTKSSSIEKTSTMMSQLSVTMAREIIKSPTYFRGAKDDVIEWLEKLEQRFTMANWTDELKLQYISIHLQEDAYRWWNQSSAKITTWSRFVEAIKQAFGSTKMKELTFEQLRTYKQAINQSITQYYDKVIELCKRIDLSMTDSMKLQYLMAGVKQSLKLHIALYDPKSSDEFLSYARKVEDTLSLTSTEYDLNQYDNCQNMTYDRQPTTSTINSRQNTDHRRINVHQSQLQTATSGQMNKTNNNNNTYPSSSRYTTSNRSSVVCYACGTPGHYARDCTRSHFQ